MGLDGAAVVGAGGQVLHGAGSVLVCVNDVNSGLASDASVTVPLGAASAAAGGGLVQRRGGRVGLDGAAVVGAGGQVLHGAGSVLVCVNDVNSGLASDASVTVPFGAASVAAGGGLVQRRGGRRGVPTGRDGRRKNWWCEAWQGTLCMLAGPVKSLAAAGAAQGLWKM